MRDGAGAHAALGSDEGEDLPQRARLGILIEVGDGLDHLHLMQRRDKILADALPDQFAVENDVIDVPDHDDLGVRLADLSQLVELREDDLARAMRLDQEHVRG